MTSFDLLIGYSGIISFAHTMFFGIGAYGVGLALHAMGPTWLSLTGGLVAAVALSFALAVTIGLFSLRVKALFFAMLAVGNAFSVLAVRLSWLTGAKKAGLSRCRNCSARPSSCSTDLFWVSTSTVELWRTKNVCGWFGNNRRAMSSSPMLA